MLWMLLLQAAPPAPDIALVATVEAREVKVESKGQATIAATATPDGGSRAEASGDGQRYELRIEARIADPLPADETGDSPQR
ncbi:hypothetical protein [Sphingomicrobium lutaoense]|uniref:Uncharacterized protein n=1 Tax=Sphingomicrobium lutaoense TaxID=515949 RepID=A0A839Z5Y0_9SPHN|nr:hypothetical protein [Sphingomicrobium lutaoense]MBB3765022.1 hypothetical protein [Sphingomicrobium lutaoense]